MRNGGAAHKNQKRRGILIELRAVVIRSIGERSLCRTVSIPLTALLQSPLAPNPQIPIDKIGALIGPGGKNVKALCQQYGVTINTDDDGTVTIYGKTGEAADKAKAAVKGICEDPEPGTIYQGTVKRIMDFGAFIEILPGNEWMIEEFQKEVDARWQELLDLEEITNRE